MAILQAVVPDEHKAVCDKCFPGLRVMIKNKWRAKASAIAEAMDMAAPDGDVEAGPGAATDG